jgi:hypothetical protein
LVVVEKPVRPKYVARRAGPPPTYVKEDDVPPKVDFSTDKLPPFPLTSLPIPRKAPEIISLSPGASCFTKAIAAASDGATIRVPAGVYCESFTVAKSLCFFAEGHVSLHSDGSQDTVTVRGAFVSFEGFAIKQKASRARCAVAVVDGHILLTNCKVRSSAVGSLITRGDAKVKLVRCHILAKDATIPCANLLGRTQIIAECCVFSNTRTPAVNLKGNAIGRIVRCLFRNAQRGSISSTDSSRVFVDSCRLVECAMEVSNSSAENVIAGTTIIGQRVVCSKTTQVAFRQNNISHAVIDSRDEAQLTLSENKFDGASLVVWGRGAAVSDSDAFAGTAKASIAVSGHGTLTLSDVSIVGVDGSGVVAYEDATVTIEAGKIETCGRSAIVGHSGASIIARSTTLSGSRRTSIVLDGTKTVSFSAITIADSAASGAEVANTRDCHFTDCVICDCAACGLAFIRAQADIIKCQFTGNKFAGLHGGDQSELSVNESRFRGNVRGGMLVTERASVKVANSSFTENKRAAVAVAGTATAVVDGSQFESNEVGVTNVGEVILSASSFKKHNTAGVVAGGKFTLSETTFEEEAIGVAAVSGANLTGTAVAFQSNRRHVEVTGGVIRFQQSTFTGSVGEAGVHVKGGSATFDECTFQDDKEVTIFSEGETNVTNSTVTNAGRIGVVFNKGASGTMTNSKFLKNGDCAFQCLGGEPTINENTISEHKRFGVFVFPPAAPVIEGNKFEENITANIWRALTPSRSDRK